MLKNLWRCQLFNRIATNVNAISLRQTGTDTGTRLYEPPYLDALIPKYPVYDLINFQTHSYDFTALESYQRLLHNILDRMTVDITDAWATPPQKLHVTRLKPYSQLVEADYNLTVYERNIQATTVPAYLYPVVLRMATAALPEGVSLTVLPHGKYLDTVRYVPDNDLRDLKMELEDVGSDKKKKKKFVPKKI